MYQTPSSQFWGATIEVPKDRQEIRDDVYDSLDGENWFVGTNKAWQKSPLSSTFLITSKINGINVANAPRLLWICR